MVGAEYAPRKKSNYESRLGGSSAFSWFEYDVKTVLAFAGLFVASFFCFFFWFWIFFKAVIRKWRTLNSHTSICHVLLCHSNLNKGFHNFTVMHSQFKIDIYLKQKCIISLKIHNCKSEKHSKVVHNNLFTNRNIPSYSSNETRWFS